MLRDYRVPRLLGTVLALLVCGLIATAGPAAAANTVTVGASLAEPPDHAGACSSPNGCGFLIVSATAPSSGTVAPFDGTVTAWQLGGTSAVPGYYVSALRRNADGTYTVTASEAPVTPAGEEIETFAAHLPIHGGEYIAVNVPYEAELSIVKTPSEEAGFAGLLTTGETRKPNEQAEAAATFAFNVDIEEGPPAAPVTPPATTTPPAPVTEPAQCKVPKLVGKSLKAAKKSLRRAGCGVGFVVRPPTTKGHPVKEAKVRAQSPKPGRSLPRGTEVSLKLKT